MKPAQLLLAAIAAATFTTAAHSEPDRLGLSLNPLMIVEKATGPAASAGIQPGDKVLAVDGTPLEDAETLRPFEKVTGTVALLIQRADETFYVPVVLDDVPFEQPLNNP
jgi:predicted metalloprotease with PDZ domain